MAFPTYQVLRLASRKLYRLSRRATFLKAPLSFTSCRNFTSTLQQQAKTSPPPPPSDEAFSTRTNYLGTTKRFPEFSLSKHVTLVSGGARGLGLTMCGALLEAGSTVYALDRLSEPSPDFWVLQKLAVDNLGTELHYRQVDVRDVEGLNATVKDVAIVEGRMDGLIAAAGIQQETSALDYTAEDARRMMDVNVVGIMMTAQAVARQMVNFGTGGSIALIASMSGTVANKGLFPKL